MNYKKIILDNFFWLSLGQIASRLLGALFFFYLAAKIGSEGIGIYSFVFSFLGIFFIFNDFGLYQYLVRRWSKDDSGWREEFSIAFSLRLITVVILAVVAVVYGFVFERIILAELALAFLALSLDQWRSLQEAYFSAHNRFRIISATQTAQRFFEVVLAGLLLFFGFGLKTVLVIYVLGRLLNIIYLNFREKFYYKLIFSLQKFWELGRRSLPFLFIGLFTAIYFKIDTVMIRYLIDYEAVGWYNAAYKFISLAAIIPGLAAASAFPTMSRLFKENAIPALRRIVSKVIKLMLVLVLPATGVGFVLAEWVINFVYQPEFEPATLVLKILIFALPFMFISVILLSLLAAERREKTVLKITSSAAALNIGLNFIMIPLFSIYGAALATVITEAGVLLYAVYISKYG